MRVPQKSLIALPAVALVAATLAIHGWYAITTATYVNHVTGVWLALADDLTRGVFYRDLLGPAGYGGTRYFPLFFAAIAGLMNAGLGPLAAGFSVSLLGGVLLVGGVHRLLSQLGLPRQSVAVLAALALAAPFVQQTLFSIRSDVLATALAVLGLSFSVSACRGDAWTVRTLGIAGAMFTLAIATKVTSLYAPAAAVTTMLLCGRRRAAGQLSLFLTAGGLGLLLVLWLGSGGRAIESFRACALGGSTVREWLAGGWGSAASVFWGPSRLLSAVVATATVAWLAGLRRSWSSLPSVLFPFAVAMTAFVLSSPGTIQTNQVTDVYVAALIVIGASSVPRPRLQTATAIVALVLSVAVARVNLGNWWTDAERREAERRHGERRELIARLDDFRSPVLSEAPELPVLARTRPILVDPFALRVVLIGRPDVKRHLIGRIDRRAFSHVVLLQDPETPAGRGWYTNVEFGWPVMERILANYRFAATKAGVRIYVPRPAAER